MSQRYETVDWTRANQRFLCWSLGSSVLSLALSSVSKVVLETLPGLWSIFLVFVAMYGSIFVCVVSAFGCVVTNSMRRGSIVSNLCPISFAGIAIAGF